MSKAKKPDKPKRGRPSKYTQELADEICARLSKGEPLAQICRDEHMPGLRTAQDWKLADTNYAAAIARAREEGFDHIALECLEIADDATNDYMDKRAKEGDERASESVLNGEHVQRSKLRIETRLKLLAKWDPKRYGDKLELGGGTDNKMTVQIIRYGDNPTT